jgi:IS30 family transposase
MLIQVPSKDTTTVVAALSKHVRKHSAALRRSLTNGRLNQRPRKTLGFETLASKLQASAASTS